MTYPLAGVRVLDLTRLLPGGYCTLLLADLGAEVVKVEDPQGGDYSRLMPPFTPDGVGAVYAALNRGKQSVILDLKRDEDRDLFLRLAERADVVVESFRPGVLDRLGVGPATLLARNPRLVYCGLTGYGQTGPLRDVVGHDINYIGTAGLLDLNGPPDGPPVVPGAQLADLSGALVATLGILAALLRRATTGQGGVVDTSMTEAAFALLSLPWAEFAGAGQAATRGAHILSGGWACYNVYRAADGRYLALGCLEPKFWAAFCRAVEQPDWTGQQFDPTLQPALKDAVAALLAGQPASVWLDRVAGRDIPLTLVNSLADLPDAPQFAARGVLFPSAAGLAARSPIRLDDLPPAATTPAPGYGATSASALLEAWSGT